MQKETGSFSDLSSCQKSVWDVRFAGLSFEHHLAGEADQAARVVPPAEGAAHRLRGHQALPQARLLRGHRAQCAEVEHGGAAVRSGEGGPKEGQRHTIFASGRRTSAHKKH